MSMTPVSVLDALAALEALEAEFGRATKAPFVAAYVEQLTKLLAARSCSGAYSVDDYISLYGGRCDTGRPTKGGEQSP